MAILRGQDERTEGPLVVLGSHCLVGRSAACSWRLSDRRVSLEHARIQWVHGRWQLRDLNSSNGTQVNDQLVEREAVVNLRAGDRIRFGDEGGTWIVLDAGPPGVCARDLDSGEVIHAKQDILRFPGAEGPFPYLAGSREQGWSLEAEEGASAAHDGMVVQAGSRRWILHLTEQPEETEAVTDTSAGWSVGDVRWVFSLSLDEEYLAVQLQVGGTSLDLGAKAHHYLLLTLARIREQDSPGWVYADELARRLNIDAAHLNVQIYRARAELEALGVIDALDIIERRRSTRQLRANIERFEVVSV